MGEQDMNKAFSKAVIEVAKDRAKDLYEDGLKPATKEGGEILQAVVGLFNNVVLYPIKKANITFKYKLEKFEMDLQEKTSKIPEDKLIEPPLMISGPTLEALRYTYDTKELRDMYLKLLSSSMNLDTVMLAHPAYVDIIKSMTPLDAIIFTRLRDLRQVPCAGITICFSNKVYSKAMPKIYAPDVIRDNDDPFLVSSSLDNLCRMGLLNHRYQVTIEGFNYDDYRNHEFVKKQFELMQKIDKGEHTLEIKIEQEVLVVSDFGFNFASACLE